MLYLWTWYFSVSGIVRVIGLWNAHTRDFQSADPRMHELITSRLHRNREPELFLHFDLFLHQLPKPVFPALLFVPASLLFPLGCRNQSWPPIHRARFAGTHSGNGDPSS